MKNKDVLKNNLKKVEEIFNVVIKIKLASLKSAFFVLEYTTANKNVLKIATRALSKSVLDAILDMPLIIKENAFKTVELATNIFKFTLLRIESV